MVMASTNAWLDRFGLFLNLEYLPRDQGLFFIHDGQLLDREQEEKRGMVCEWSDVGRQKSLFRQIP